VPIEENPTLFSDGFVCLSGFAASVIFRYPVFTVHI
jgi:hypothetical protein